PSGCRFRTRCVFAEEICAARRPALGGSSSHAAHLVACHMADPQSGHSRTAPSSQRAAALGCWTLLDQTARSELPLVEVDDLHVRFFDGDETVWAVNGVSFELMPGEVLCIIGESGSGKSVTMRALMRFLPGQRSVISGRIRIGQFDIMALDERRMS